MMARCTVESWGLRCRERTLKVGSSGLRLRAWPFLNSKAPSGSISLWLQQSF